MNIRLLLLTLFLVSAMQAANRDLIILLDWGTERIEVDLNKKLNALTDSESTPGFGPITSFLITALMQKAAPVLVSSATWLNFVQRKLLYQDFITLNDKELQKKYQGKSNKFETEAEVTEFARLCKSYLLQQHISDNNIYANVMMYFICSQQSLDGWQMRRVSDHYYLLIPTDYWISINKEGKMQGGTSIAEKISDDDLILGLKRGTRVSDPFNVNEFDDSYRVSFRKEFLELLPKLFVTIRDVRDPKKIREKTEENITKFLHTWYIVMWGHGDPTKNIEGIIAGLFVDQFQQLLQFLNTQISTSFLFYETCFAGGQHLQQPYQQIIAYPPVSPKKGPREAVRALVFNYSIVASTLFYAGTSSYLVVMPSPFYKGTKPVTQYEFTWFFAAIHRYINPPSNPNEGWGIIKSTVLRELLLSLDNIINLIHKFLRVPGVINENVQIPVIRYPGTGWFSVVDFSTKIMRLTKTMFEVKEAEGNDIIIKNKQIVIFDAERLGILKKSIEPIHREITVPLRIYNDGGSGPLFISSSSGPAYYYIEKIVASQSTLVEFIKSFLPFEKSEYPRTYYIKKLLCRGSLFQEQSDLLGVKPWENLELNDVIIVDSAKNPINVKDTHEVQGVFFKYQLNKFAAWWSSGDTKQYDLLKTGKIPGNFKKVDLVPAPYPFPLKEPREEPRLKKVAETLKVIVLRTSLKKLSQQLNDLIRKLPHDKGR